MHNIVPITIKRKSRPTHIINQQKLNSIPHVYDLNINYQSNTIKTNRKKKDKIPI